MPTKVLLCGATGFIGRNLLGHFLKDPQYRVAATYHRTRPPQEFAHHPRARFIKANLCDPKDVAKLVKGIDLVVQAAATTSGAQDIVKRPYLHVTDNAVMNSLLFRACHQRKIKRVIFFSCTFMYPSQNSPVKESDFNHAISSPYFGVGWTKVYIEKMAEFYANLGPTRYTVIRHSNIYGPHDKFDLERSHVFGATLAKVINAKDGKIVVWGDGSQARDLLYIDDLVRFVALAIKNQNTPFELVNVGSGKALAVSTLVKKIIAASGKKLSVVYDRSRPSIPFKLAVDYSQATRVFGWSPQISIEEGIDKTIAWYRRHVLK